MGIALGAYESAHGMFPPGGARGFSFMVFMLPHLDQSALYDAIDFSQDSETGNPRIRSTVIPLFVCPSDPAPAVPAGTSPFTASARTNYAGNSGTGVQQYGFNGMFQHLVTTLKLFPEGPVRAAQVTHGLSQTAAISELLHADASFARLRVNWNTPRELTQPDQLDAFAQVCESLPPSPRDRGWTGDANRGSAWMHGDSGCTFYNHVLTPGSVSCYNGTEVQTGISSAASAHSRGVNVLFADGHVGFIGGGVDGLVWVALGSRTDRVLRLTAAD